MRFRKAQTPRLDPAQARRQGEITRLAFLLLGRDAAIAFLNGHHAQLRGRPLDLATASDEGRNLVEAEIGRQVYSATPECGAGAGGREHLPNSFDELAGTAGGGRRRRPRDPAEAHFRRLGEAAPDDQGNP